MSVEADQVKTPVTPQSQKALSRQKVWILFSNFEYLKTLETLGSKCRGPENIREKSQETPKEGHSKVKAWT